MLSLHDASWTRTCAGLSRREMLRLGGLGLGLSGLTLPGLLAARAQAAAAARGVVRDKAVVLLFLQGGPPQVETFDPKLGVGEKNRSCTGEVKTSSPGVYFGGTFPKMARMMDRLAVVRSFASGDGGHNQEPILTGNSSLKAPMGAMVARAVGSLHPRTGTPTNVVLVPESIDPTLKLNQPTGPFTYGYVTKTYVPGGSLGSQCDAFVPGGGGQSMQNLTLQLARDRFENRRDLLTRLDSVKAQLDQPAARQGLDAFQQQAFDVLLRGVAAAFDLSQEDKATVARYDTSHLFRMADYHKGGKHYNGLVNQSRVSNLLGKQLLLARRLCEAGCGFVTVVDSCWDFHGDGNNPPTPVGMSFLGPQLDHAVAAFLDDVHQRGLSDKILLVITGEMGRTPVKNSKNGGTDHLAGLTPLVLAGGGLKMGQVIGESNHTGSAPATRRYGPENLLATVLHALFDVGRLRTAPEALPASISQMALDGHPIAELF